MLPDRRPDGAAGHDLFTDRCAACHALPDPCDRSPMEWRVILKRMGPRAGLAPAEQGDVLEFVTEEKR